MCINFILFLVLVIRESVGNNVFVDLKSNYISNGITVHHGRFSVNGKYRMYIGKDKGIESVIFGTGVLYRRAECPIGEQVIVEMFEDIIVKYFVIHIYTGTVLNHTRVKRKYYSKSDWGYKKIDQNTFMTQMTSEVELMFDVATKIIHPYMVQMVESEKYYTETYSLIDQVGGIKLDGLEAPKYTYGIVYDSSMMIKMGYSALESFVSKCERFSIEYK
ncbi:conserved hypothetical protein [Theileria orientalis strain Shintoku]|uniref:Uncharacterized protein n=1 Tax=Theileria orientalis strain Shintoku TaxID=869250 RepID=J4C3W1_THEOR|nr:conserved hypothetical protein [Theileria orientalis strain Shintoku]PVC54342.1 hypothetical protein MACL_00003133 [Theileria orientalis]BAM41126.1 conserved hypothetical protein [Theileria orientalis strain Shintoku]|eukprot:XP_009691427.1 conserved hypothetical protein [Theileria orientalis strain Shintoku]